MSADKGSATLDAERGVLAFFRYHRLRLAVPALVGFSGGPDSTALLAILAGMGAGPLKALHIDHGIRPETERREERTRVIALAGSLGIPLVLARIRPGAVEKWAAKRGSGIEAAARWYRQRIFATRLSVHRCERLYLGHTMDDSVEGILMGFLGGAGQGGMGGIAPLAGKIARPLSSVSKSDVLLYLGEKRLGYSVDSTNADIHMKRNRIRALLIPLLDDSFPGWRRGILHGMAKAVLDEEVLGTLSRSLRFEENPATRDLEFPRPSFMSAPLAIQLRSLVDAYSRMDARPGRESRFSGGRVSWRMAGKAQEAVRQGHSYDAHGLRLEGEGDMLRLSSSLDFGGGDGYFVSLTERDLDVDISLPSGFQIKISWVPSGGSAGIIEGSFDFPLVIRTRRPGDAIALRRGSKAVDELLGSWHIPLHLRNKIALAEDRRGVIAVLGEGAPGGKNRFRHLATPPVALRCLSIIVKGA